MAAIRVLRFARTDDKSSFVLLQIISKGPKALDLKLVGTEGEAPYVASLKHDRVSSLRVKNCPASESEWQAILEALLKQEPLPDIQAAATVQSESSISITIRKQIGGITQRLGAITLNHDADEAIELFDWCGVAVEASAAGKEAVADLAAKSNDAEAAVAQLKAQLDELIQAKEEDETALLQRFRDLLNEKKVKIREQQQVLAASGSFNVSHPGTSSQQPEPAPTQKAPSKPARKAAKSRSTKRKAPASKRVEEDEEDEDVQNMEIDVKQEEQETDPGNTTEDTASVISDSEGEEASASSRRGGQVAPPALEPQEETPPKKTKEQPPPPRALPFGNKKPTQKTPAPAPAGGSDTESDDEL